MIKQLKALGSAPGADAPDDRAPPVGAGEGGAAPAEGETEAIKTNLTDARIVLSHYANMS